MRSTEINIEQDQISQFDFNLGDISIGKEVGRTKLKRKRPDIDNGQISLYSSSTVMSSTISAEASTASGNSLLKTQDSKYPKEIKGVFLQRCFKFLGNILIKNDLLLKFLSYEEKIEETHIIVDSTLLTVESFFLCILSIFKRRFGFFRVFLLKMVHISYCL